MQEKTMQENKLIPITADFVRGLRMSGREQEAKFLVRIHHISIRKARREAFNDICRQERLVKKSKGLCLIYGCTNKINKSTNFCKKHRTRKNELQIIWRKKRFKMGLCKNCKNRRMIEYTLCNQCNVKNNQRYSSKSNAKELSRSGMP